MTDHLKNWTTTVVEVRKNGEWGTFFVRESDVLPRDGGGFNVSAEWCCNSSFGVFGHYWSSMGKPFGEFVSKINNDYLLGKIGKQVTDSRKVVRELRRLVIEHRKEQTITKDEAREALDDIEELAAYDDGDVLCHKLYESGPLSKCHIEWCDIESKTWDCQSLGFVKQLWPEFVRKFCERVQAELGEEKCESR